MRYSALPDMSKLTMRRFVGFAFLGIGIIGAIFPIIPGWPGLLIAVALLGRRDRSLRLTHLLLRRSLRRMRRAQQPTVRRVGRWLSTEYVQMRRILAPKLAATERLFGSA